MTDFSFDYNKARTAFTKGELWKIGKGAPVSKHTISARVILQIFTKSTLVTNERGETENIDSSRGYDTIMIREGNTKRAYRAYKGFILFEQFGLYGNIIDMEKFLENHKNDDLFGAVDLDYNFVSYEDFAPIREYLDVLDHNQTIQPLLPLPDISDIRNIYEQLKEIVRRDDENSSNLLIR